MTNTYLDNLLGELPLIEKEVPPNYAHPNPSKPIYVKDKKAIKARRKAFRQATKDALKQCTGNIRLEDRIVPNHVFLDSQFKDADSRPPQELYKFQRQVTDVLYVFGHKRNWCPS